MSHHVLNWDNRGFETPTEFLSQYANISFNNHLSWEDFGWLTWRYCMHRWFHAVADLPTETNSNHFLHIFLSIYGTYVIGLWSSVSWFSAPPALHPPFSHRSLSSAIPSILLPPLSFLRRSAIVQPAKLLQHITTMSTVRSKFSRHKNSIALSWEHRSPFGVRLLHNIYS